MKKQLLTVENLDRLSRPENQSKAIDGLRLLLIFLYCVNMYGLPTPLGPYIQTGCTFVPVAFFMLSGYLVLGKEEGREARIVRSIKRSAIMFGVLTVVLFLYNLVYYKLIGMSIINDIFPAFSSRRFWFNFVVMNVWQFNVGSPIWYVQALLYAYIIIYFLNKIKALKLDWLIFALLFVFAVMTGEFAGIFRFNVLGYVYLPGNFLTRALPYILFGGFVGKNIEKFLNVRAYWYVFGIIIGFIMIAVEPLVLWMFGRPGYYGHLIGMPIVSLSMLVLTVMIGEMNVQDDYMLFGMSRWEINLSWYLYILIGPMIAVMFGLFGAEVFVKMSPYIGLITFTISFGVPVLIYYIRKKKYNISFD